MISLLLFGVYVYFVGGLGMADYYQAISVPLFFYAILVAFMMDRLIKSDELEEQLAIGIMNYIDENAAKIGAAAEVCREHVLGIVTTNDISQVNAHYRAVRNNASKALAAVYGPLDQLALSKVRGTTFSEMFIIFIVGLLTVFSSVVFRPNDLIRRLRVFHDTGSLGKPPAVLSRTGEKRGDVARPAYHRGSFRRAHHCRRADPDDPAGLRQPFTGEARGDSLEKSTGSCNGR
jgi:hypothetical protein